MIEWEAEATDAVGDEARPARMSATRARARRMREDRGTQALALLLRLAESHSRKPLLSGVAPCMDLKICVIRVKTRERPSERAT